MTSIKSGYQACYFFFERKRVWKIFRWKSIVISSLISIYIWRIHYDTRCFYTVFHRSPNVSSECKYLMPIKRNWESMRRFQIIIHCSYVYICVCVCSVTSYISKDVFFTEMQFIREEFVLENKISKFIHPLNH